MLDIAIIGAGVVGALLAHEASYYQGAIAIFEKGNDIALGASKANSGIVHAGYDAPFGTAMNRTNVRGNARYGPLSKTLSFPFVQCGSLVVAYQQEELKELKRLYENGLRSEVPGLKLLSKEEALIKEPHLPKTIHGALYAPTAGITEPWEVANSAIEDAINHGASLYLNHEILSITKKEEHYELKTNQGTFFSKTVINAGGIYADDLAAMVTKEYRFRIKPRRGEYYLLDRTTAGYVQHVLFPAPSLLGKGVLVVPTVDGNILIGPNAENLSVEDKDNVATTMEGLTFVKEHASSQVTNLPFSENITTFAGLRAHPSTEDFVLDQPVEGFFNAAGIKSPGLSAAPAIAEEVLQGVVDYLGLEKKTTPRIKRKPRVRFRDLDPQEQAALIQENPAYGHMVCRCEQITEGEIIDAITRPGGARTINGIKRRVRAGAGRCQGGFCGPRVIEILAKTLSCQPEDIVYEGKDSYILMGPTKEAKDEDN